MVSSVELTDQTPPTKVAIKEPLADSQTIDTEDIQAFLNEADTWKTVDRREREKPRWKAYEHIVGVVDTGETIPWIAMEYMDGGSLADRLETNPNGLPIDEALWIGECVCRGVEIAHNYGIAHLDLKPANVLFSETSGDVWDVAKVADWGLARVLAEQTGTMEALSIQYAAPEQFDPDEFGDPDTLTDVYQVGALLYAMITGEPPYTGGRLSVMQNITSESNVASPGTVRANLPSVINQAVRLALARQKTFRYDNITTLKRALKSIRTEGRLPLQLLNQFEDIDVTLNNKTNSDKIDAVDTDGKNWAMFQRTATRSGYQPTTGPRNSVKIKWQFHADHGVQSSPAVVDDTVYIGSWDSHIYALDAVNGNECWRFSTNNKITATSPAVADDVAYIGSEDNHVYAINTSEGTERWRFNTGDKVWSSPVVVNDTIYIGSRNNQIYAIDASNGAQRWSFQTDDQVWSSPAVADGFVYSGSADGCVYALFADDGTKHWSFQTNGAVVTSPAVVNDTVYFGSMDNHIYALDAIDGTECWRFQADNQVNASPVVADGTVYVGSKDNHVYAIDAYDGTENWRFRTGDSVNSSPAVDNDIVYVGSEDHCIYAIDAINGSEHWHFQTNGGVESSPAIVNKTVYFGSDDGCVYALSED